MSLVVRELRREVPSSTGDASLRVVFSGLSLEVQAGSPLFITGRSGAGKSLLLRVIAGLDEAQGGTVSCDGRSLEELGAPSWRAQVCYVSQARWALAGSPLDSWAELCSFAAQKVRSRAHRDPLKIAHDLALQPDCLSSPWATLSGGQAQRCALALALALNPPVLLLDEPTSACDAATALAVEAALLASGAALLWVTHDAAQSARCGGRTFAFPSDD